MCAQASQPTVVALRLAGLLYWRDSMPTANTAAVSSTFLIDPNALWHALTGLTPPLVIDARVADDLAMMPARLPTAITQSGLAVANWQAQPAGLPIVIYCQKGLKISQGAAAWLRANRADTRGAGWWY